MINKSDSRCAVVRFCYHSYDYRSNWTPLSPITITYYMASSASDSMQRILCSDWLPEQARWSDTARPGLPVLFAKVQASARKFSFVEIIFCQGKKIFCDFSGFMEPEKASTRMKTKKTIRFARKTGKHKSLF